MNEREFPSTKVIVKRVMIVLAVILIIVVVAFLNVYYDNKREEEIGNIIRNAMTKEDEKNEENNKMKDEEKTNLSESEEPNFELIDKFEWEYDSDNKFTLAITKDIETELLSVAAFGNYTEENIGLMQNDYIIIFAMSYSSGIDSNIMSILGEDSYFLTMNGGKILLNTFPDKIIENIPESYVENAKIMMGELEDFYIKNGIKEKTHNELIYEDENVIIKYTGITGKESQYKINFSIENLSDRTLTIQLRESSINGVMAHVVCSIDVAPGKKALDGGTVFGKDAELTPMSLIKNFETKFHIFNDSDLKYGYDTKNVVVFDEE